MTDTQPAPDVAAASVEALADQLRASLTARETMRFEMQLGMSLDDMNASSVGQMVFLLWAASRGTDHAITVDEALDMGLEQLTDEVMRVAARYAPGKATGVDGPSPTPTELNASTSPLSDSTTGSPSMSSSG